MTAEIAILNKSAAVLATDSAVTIGSGSGAKIYNTVNKIFELSDVQPIGVMIYNKMSFMGLPMEVLVKEFRRRNANLELPTVLDYTEKLKDFLVSEFSHSEDEKGINLAIVIQNNLLEVVEDFNNRVDKSVIEAGKVLKSKFNQHLFDALESGRRELDSVEKSDGFNKRSLTDAEKDLAIEILKRLIPYVEFSAKVRNELFKYVRSVINSSKLSPIKTGIVVAGFGSSELCPSLAHVETDGLLNSRLKSVMIEHVNIGRDTQDASILPFAQDDMFQSFVNGTSPLFRNLQESLLQDAMRDSARMVLTPILNNPQRVEAIVNGLKGQFSILSNKYSEKSSEFVEKYFSNDVKEMIGLMPKQELATLAESLVEITSLKRKVTRARETVGGEVDVAVISRSEGLVWVKRKHYFPPELNPRFIARQAMKERNN